MTETTSPIRDVFASITDPRQSNKMQHTLPEVLTVAICGALVGADTFEEIEIGAQEKLPWLRQYLTLANGIPSHDTFARLLGLMDPDKFEAAFRRWVKGVLPKPLAPGGRARWQDQSARCQRLARPPCIWSAPLFAMEASIILGQQASAAKSNEKTALSELLTTLALEGCIVTIDAMGTQPSIAQAIWDQQADYILAVKGNQPQLKEAIDDFWEPFQSAPSQTPHQVAEEVTKDHGRLETRRCYVFDALDYLPQATRWLDLGCFAVIETRRERQGQSERENRCYVSSLAPDADQLAKAVRKHWGIENPVHWCLDVTFADDPMRARTAHAGHNLAILKRLTLNIVARHRGCTRNANVIACRPTDPCAARGHQRVRLTVIGCSQPAARGPRLRGIRTLSSPDPMTGAPLPASRDVHRQRRTKSDAA